MDNHDHAEQEEMILLAESESFDIFTDLEADLVHVDCYVQGVTLHMMRADFLELLRVCEQARDQLNVVLKEEGETLQ